MNILFLCVANSARSQIAEGLAKKILGSSHHIESAGSQPTRLNPLSVQVMAEAGVDLSGHFSKSIDQLPAEFLAHIDYVITLCAEEVCPTGVAAKKRLHWPIPDPAAQTGTDAEKLAAFRRAREAISEKLQVFIGQVR